MVRFNNRNGFASYYGHLRTSPVDTVFDSILAVSIFGAYLPQIFKMKSRGTSGLSPYFLLCGALFSNLQLANTLMISVCAWPHESGSMLAQLAVGRFRGFAALGAMLGLVQTALQWAGMIALMTMFVSRSSQSPAPSQQSSNSIGPSRPPIATVALLHAAASVLPAMLIALRPLPSPGDRYLEPFIRFSARFNTWATLVLVIVQFVPQFWALQRNAGPGALSTQWLALRGTTAMVLGIRWLQRLRYAEPAIRGSPARLFHWGWPSFVYLVDGVGCIVLLGAYFRHRRVRAEQSTTTKQAPLLPSTDHAHEDE